MFDRNTRDLPDAMVHRAFGIGILLGAAQGIGAALLMAPVTGWRYRSRFSSSSALARYTSSFASYNGARNAA